MFMHLSIFDIIIMQFSVLSLMEAYWDNVSEK